MGQLNLHAAMKTQHSENKKVKNQKPERMTGPLPAEEL